MPIPALLQFIVWFCFVLSIATVIALAILLITLDRDRANELVATAAITAIELVAIASTSCTLVLLGHSISALLVWRFASFCLFGITVWSCIRSFGSSVRSYGNSVFESRAGAQVLTVAASGVAFSFAIAGFLIPALPYVGSGKYFEQRAVANIPSLALASQVSVSEVTPYLVLSVACISFGMLFIIASRNEGPLSFERNGGGLGGNTGGWQISSSLTYLLATIAAAALMLLLIFHNDQLQDAREQRKADAGKSTAQPAAAAVARPETTAPAASSAAADKGASSDKPALKPGDHPNAD